MESFQYILSEHDTRTSALPMHIQARPQSHYQHFLWRECCQTIFRSSAGGKTTRGTKRELHSYSQKGFFLFPSHKWIQNLKEKPRRRQAWRKYTTQGIFFLFQALTVCYIRQDKESPLPWEEFSARPVWKQYRSCVSLWVAPLQDPEDIPLEAFLSTPTKGTF